jgi:adenine-specific DNA-methyltransferase
MNYIGSKYRLSSFIKETVCSIVGHNLSYMILCDLFAGTGIVGRLFKKEVKRVISNDIEYYSYVLNKNYIENHIYWKPQIKLRIQHLYHLYYIWSISQEYKAICIKGCRLGTCIV